MTLKSFLTLTFLLLAFPIHAAQTAEELQSTIKQLEKSEAPDPELLAVLKRTLNLVQSTEEASRLATSYREAASKAPQKLEALRNLSSAPDFPSKPAVDATVQSLNQSLLDIAAELDAARNKADSARTEIKRRSEILASIPDRIAQARSELSSLAEITEPPSTASQLAKAEHQLKIEKRQALKASIAKLEAEQERYLAESSLLATRQQIASENAKQLTKIQSRWQNALQQKRIAEAEIARKRAKRQISQLSNIPELADIAESNAKLADMRSGTNGLSSRIASISAYQSKIEADLARVKEQRDSAKDRITLLENAGLEIDTGIGALLRRHRAGIPDIDAITDDLKQHLQNSANAQLNLIELETASANELTDIDSRVEALFQKYQGKGVKKETIRELLTQRRELLDQVIADHRTYLKRIGKTNQTTRNAIEVFSEYALYLDERLLWIPSAERIHFNDFPREGKALLKLISPSVGGRWLENMAQDFADFWFLWLPALLAIITLLYRRRFIRKKLISVGEAASRRNCTSFVPTLKALIYSVALTAPIPLATSFLAWRTETTSPFYSALISLTLFTGFVGFFRRLCRPNGILHSHIKLDAHRTILMRKNLLWYLPLMMPVVFVVSALLGLHQGGGTGRIVFILAMITTWILFFVLTKPSNKLLYKGSKPSRFAKIAYILCIIIPPALIAGAALGYFQSVLIIRQQVLASLSLILIIAFFVALLLRWGLVSRRNLALKQALRRREAALAERKKAEEKEGEQPVSEENPSDIPTLEEVKAEAVDVADVQEKTAHLIKVAAACALAFGLYGIWDASLPALAGLDDIRLWGENTSKQEQTENTDSSSPLPSFPATGSDTPEDTTETADASESEKDSKSPVSLIEPEDDQVTLQDLLIFFIALFLTFTAARNIPSLLELTLLNRLNLKPGGSFAVTTAITYSIVVVGIVIAFAQIGVTWGKVQWIAAAVTLGIGFGLQEVFANFVAGLILLFERPIRLGDYISVGDVSGRVTQIKIRATTIQQLNNRELIVPNKEFITGQVVNWTLKDPVLRAEVLVGIAYGSDTKLARKELIKVAEANSRVVKTQKTDVIFEDFSDSTLNMLLRTHVSGIENFIPVHSELRFAIDDAFRKANIEIAFPQRDIHIRSVTNLTDALKKADESAEHTAQ